ncbi:MAG: ABC transporter permease [Patescibacteria group bacterium]
MSFKRIFAISLRFGYLLKHNKIRFINIFAWAFFDITVWGITTLYLDGVSKASFSIFTVLMGGAILWLFLIRVQQGFILPALEDVWSRNFMNLFASPLSFTEYVLGLILTGFLTTIVGFSFILIIAYLFFSYSIFQFGFLLIPFIFILFIFGLALGAFAFSLILRFGAPAEWLIWILPFILSPLSSVYYPISALPIWAQYLAKTLPTSYIFEGMRNFLINGIFSLENLIIGFIVSFIYLAIAYWFLIYNYRLAIRNGLITRITAESF